MESRAQNPLVAQWTRATFRGWSLGFLLIIACIAVSSLAGLGDTQFPVGLGMAIGVGAMQRKIIAERLQTTTSWWRATIIGITAPFFVWDVLHQLDIAVLYPLPTVVVAGGLVAGVLQARVLRAHTARSAEWIMASLAGWTLAAGTVVLNDKVLPKIPGIAGALIYIAVILMGGVLLGAVTGAALDRILNAK